MTAGAQHQLDALMDAFFTAVSFAAGEAPRYEALYDLFVDGGRLIRNSDEAPEISTVEEFIAPRQREVQAGELTEFEETELRTINEVFGRVAHRLSVYSKRGVRGGEAFDGRGVIFTQFLDTPSGWRIASMAWDDERPGLTMPKRYEPGA